MHRLASILVLIFASVIGLIAEGTCRCKSFSNVFCVKIIPTENNTCVAGSGSCSGCSCDTAGTFDCEVIEITHYEFIDGSQNGTCSQINSTVALCPSPPPTPSPEPTASPGPTASPTPSPSPSPVPTPLPSPSLTQTFNASILDGTFGELNSVAIESAYVIVGDSTEGVVYWYHRFSGALVKEITPDESVDSFGTAVAMEYKILVGAYNKAYVFDYEFTGEYLQAHILTSPDGVGNFGYSVALSGLIGVVGAWGDNSGQIGAAYVFDVNTGSLLHSLTPINGLSNSYFGWSVAASGDYVMVGAPWHDDKGAAFLFNSITGSQVWHYQSSDPALNERFGTSVDVRHSTEITVLIGSNPSVSELGGKVSVYNISEKLYTLDGPTGATGFGEPILFSGEYMFVGAAYEDTLNRAEGAVYIYEWATGNQLHKISITDAPSFMLFGRSLAVYHNSTSISLVVGSRGVPVEETSRLAQVFAFVF